MNGFVFVSLIALVIWIGLALYVYSHATSMGKGGAFWGLISLVFGVFGVVIYLLSVTTDLQREMNSTERHSQRQSTRNSTPRDVDRERGSGVWNVVFDDDDIVVTDDRYEARFAVRGGSLSLDGTNGNPAPLWIEDAKAYAERKI